MPEQSRLTEISPPAQPAYLPAGAYYPSFPPQEFEPEAPTVPLSHYLWVLRRHRWEITAFVAICVLATAVVSARLQPVYESTATVDVDRRTPSEVVGQDSTRAADPNDADQFLATQVRLIQSDAVLRPVAEQYKLLDMEGQLGRLSPDKVQQASQAPITLKRLKVTRPPNTYLLLISYRSTDPNLAAETANAIATSSTPSMPNGLVTDSEQ